MANRAAAALWLREGDRERLRSLTRSSSVRAGVAQRARIVLLAAEGVSNTAIADKVGVTRQTVLGWRGRYERSGILGLDDAERSGRPRHVDHREIVATTLQPPPKKLGVTHWSSRLLAAQLGLGNATVARAWRDYGVQPWRAETFKFSTDPELIAKVTDVVGLYLAPPENAIVWSIDEKSQIQALDRTQKMIRCNRGSPSGAPTTTYGTAPLRCSQRWRSRPGRSLRPASPGTVTRSSWPSSNRSPAPTPPTSTSTAGRSSCT